MSGEICLGAPKVAMFVDRGHKLNCNEYINFKKTFWKKYRNNISKFGLIIIISYFTEIYIANNSKLIATRCLTRHVNKSVIKVKQFGTYFWYQNCL